MIELHERLSEFSYGYGVTRETEKLLASVGLTPTPFMPSLVHENEVGFDVAFDRPGAVVMLQFKLGQQMQRYRSTSSALPSSPLAKPFWRFRIDCGEAQFILLREAERKGAEVYYVAPRFSDWTIYQEAYQTDTVLARSLMITPREISRGIAGSGTPIGSHRIVYDNSARYVCSNPTPVDETSPDELAKQVLTSLRQKPRRMRDFLSDLAETPRLGRIRDRRRIGMREDLRARARTPDDASAAIVALEAWLVGAQAIFVTDPHGG
jgi:hypothetical protein